MTAYNHQARDQSSKKRKHNTGDVREHKRSKIKEQQNNLQYVLPPRHRKRFQEQKKSKQQPQQASHPYLNPFYPPQQYTNYCNPNYLNNNNNNNNNNINNNNNNNLNYPNLIPEESLLKDHDFDISSSASNPSNSTDIPQTTNPNTEIPQYNPNLNCNTNISTNLASANTIANPAPVALIQPQIEAQCIDSRQFEYDLLCNKGVNNGYMYNIYDGEYFVSIDVECGATGFGHFDFAPVRISMVDFYGNILFDRICCIPNLMDPLSEFTGLNMQEIALYGDPLEDVLREFHEILAYYNVLYKYGVVLVGQSVIMDIIWTKLKEGAHYSRIIDIAHQFRTKEHKWSKFMYYSLRQVAWCLLGRNMNEEYHDPTEDAHVSMQLYRDFCLDEHVLNCAKEKLQHTKKKNIFPNFKVYTHFPQCSAMYSPNKCVCGQTSACDLSAYDDIEKLRQLFSEHSKKPVRHIWN